MQIASRHVGLLFGMSIIAVLILCGFTKPSRERPITPALLKERIVEQIGVWLEKVGTLISLTGKTQTDTVHTMRRYVHNEGTTVLSTLQNKEQLQKLHDSYQSLVEATEVYIKTLEKHGKLIEEISA